MNVPSTSHDTMAREDTSVKMRRLNIERFSGDFSKWPKFKELFEEFVHNNVKLADVTKFLRLALIQPDSEASQTISGFTRVGANYQAAWEQLCQTYDNSRKLVEDLVGNFLDLAPISVPTRSAMVTLINSTNHLVASLPKYDIAVNHWDPIVVQILTRKLDNETINAWNYERPQREIPRLAPLLDFLHRRADSLPEMIQNQQLQQRNRANTSNVNVVNRNNRMGVNNQWQNRTKKPVRCVMCGQEHQLFNCASFRKLDLEGKKRKVQQYRVCENCLKLHCSPERCSLKPCRNCNVKHNGLLCDKSGYPSANAAVNTTTAD